MFTLNKFHFSARASLISVAKSGENYVIHSLHNGGMVPMMELGFSDTVKEELFPWELKLTEGDREHKMCLFGKDGVCFSEREALLR